MLLEALLLWLAAQDRFFVVHGLVDLLYPIHEAHLSPGGPLVYRGISGEQFHGSKAS